MLKGLLGDFLVVEPFAGYYRRPWLRLEDQGPRRQRTWQLQSAKRQPVCAALHHLEITKNKPVDSIVIFLKAVPRPWLLGWLLGYTVATPLVAMGTAVQCQTLRLRRPLWQDNAIYSQQRMYSRISDFCGFRFVARSWRVDAGHVSAVVVEVRLVSCVTLMQKLGNSCRSWSEPTLM